MSLRILHCIHHLEGGGAERQVRFLANASEAFGMKAGVVCANAKGREEFSPTVALYVARRAAVWDLRMMLDIHRAIRDFRPDVVHAWLPEVMTIPAMLLAARHRLPSVFSYRWSMHWHRPLAVVEYLTALLCSRVVISNHALTTDSAVYHWLFRRKHGTTIPNGVPLVTSTRVARSESSRERPTHRILFAGRLTKDKNWPCLLNALPLVRAARPWRLTICGVGEDQAAVQSRIAELGLRNQVDMKGYVRDLATTMNESDVLVLPSWSEGMSNVFFEAMASGLPCLVSDIPQNRALVHTHQCARLFNPMSPPDLALALTELLDSAGERQRLAAAGVTTARQYSIDTMVQRHLAVYRQMVGGALAETGLRKVIG